MLAEVRQPKRHVPRFILRGQPRDRSRHRVGRVLLDEPQQGQKRSFAQHRQEKGRDGEVRLVNQRLERRLPAARRHA